MITSTAQRVRVNTAEQINERIRRQTEANVARYSNADNDTIDRRLHELDQEWDIERCVETMAPTFTLLGLGLGITVDKKWLLLPLVVQTFFLQHALQGWCPPIPLLRRFGVRTMAEIDQERNALKALRGDYHDIQRGASRKALAAAER